MASTRTVRGLAVEHYGSVSNLAREMGWSYSKASRIANGQQEPTAKEMRELSKFLHLEDADDIVSVFSLA